MEQLDVTADGLAFGGLQAGPREGPLVLLLHGFPEQSGGWRSQLDALAAAGFWAVAPDGRGYGQSGKPEAVGSYALDRLAADVGAIATALGRERFGLVGHDWGGLVAWWAAARSGGRVERLVILNAPHPAAVRPFVREHPRQLLRSWYVGLFQLPGLPERLLAADDFAMLRRAMTGSARPGTFSRAALAEYKAAWAQPGALTGMLNWYRALVRHPPREGPVRVACPVRILWGPGDPFLDRGLAEASLALCDRGTIQWIEGAGHWLHHEEPSAVNAALVDFLRAPAGAGPAR